MKHSRKEIIVPPTGATGAAHARDRNVAFFNWRKDSSTFQGWCDYSPLRYALSPSAQLLAALPRSFACGEFMAMYRWLTRAAPALIVLELLAFIACARSAYADTPARNLVRPVALASFGLLDVHPPDGASYSQQSRDQYECDIAAVKQTGFDPTLADGGLPPDVAVTRQADYLRAAAACLQARGYRVKIVMDASVGT